MRLRPRATGTAGGSFNFFHWCSFSFGLFAMFIGGVQEPINQAGAALLHDPDGAVLLSIALQCDVPLDMIRGATTRNPPGPRRCSRKGWRP
jgi:hypothetical protein